MCTTGRARFKFEDIFMLGGGDLEGRSSSFSSFSLRFEGED